MWERWSDLEVSELVGKTLTDLQMTDDEIIFVCDNGEKYKMYHAQDCCESVVIEDFLGDVKDLLDSEILIANETTESGDNGWGSQTWTFYNIATVKGFVTIRWNGESNGCYSESVNFTKWIEK